MQTTFHQHCQHFRPQHLIVVVVQPQLMCADYKLSHAYPLAQSRSDAAHGLLAHACVLHYYQYEWHGAYQSPTHYLIKNQYLLPHLGIKEGFTLCKTSHIPTTPNLNSSLPTRQTGGSLSKLFWALTVSTVKSRPLASAPSYREHQPHSLETMTEPSRNHRSLLHVTTAETRSHQQQALHMVVAISALHAVTNRHVLGLRQPTQQPYQD